VKYVIYSHSHWDHASGGDVYADTARFIGHENMLKNIAMPPANTPLPQNVRVQDSNSNGQIERAEAQGTIKSMFDLYDANRDGVLNGAEVTRGPISNVRPPDLTYTDRLNINLGGKRVRSYRDQSLMPTTTRSFDLSMARMYFSRRIGSPFIDSHSARSATWRPPWRKPSKRWISNTFYAVTAL